jgi:hypothetical protein
VAHRQPAQAVVFRGASLINAYGSVEFRGRPPVCALFLRSELRRGSCNSAAIS